MFKITFLSIGDLPRGPFFEIGDELRRRLGQFSDFVHKKIKTDGDLASAIPKGAFVLVLEATGKSMTSEVFAQQLGTLIDEGRHLAVLLGGPFGLPVEIKKRADLLLSLSPMTTTHDLAHLFFLEQLYRAFTIIKGKTYHY